MSIAVSAATYFGTVFAVGIALGAARVLLVAPLLGERTAELLELPLMVAVSFVVAKSVVSASPRQSPTWGIYVGGLALAMMVGAEVGLGVVTRGVSPMTVMSDRDSVAGAAYFASLAVFAGLPWWLTRSSSKLF